MKNALISVYNKTNCEYVAKFLLSKGYTLYTSGGTYNYLKKYIPIKYNSNLLNIENVIKYPHILNGRVKTLHPHIFGGILADNNIKEHVEDLNKFKIPKINVSIVNLYPFDKTVKNTKNENDIIEQIDIGGHALIRASAKNYKDNIVLSSPTQYDYFIDNYHKIYDNIGERKNLAFKAFCHATDYDISISNYFNKNKNEKNKEKNKEKDKQKLYFSYKPKLQLKYGNNPHQKASIGLLNNTKDNTKYLPFHIINGNLSYINVLDAINSWNLVSELSICTNTISAASFKHTNAAGVSLTRELTDNEIKNNFIKNEDYNILSDTAKAYILARGVDPKSSYGDFIAISGHVDVTLANYIKKQVSDGIIAKSYSTEALCILKSKKKGKYVILQSNENSNCYQNNKYDIKTFGDFSLLQENNNNIITKKWISENIKTTKNITNENTIDMLLANITLKYTQSNSVVLAKNGTLLGVGAGQQSRIDCVKLCCQKAFANFLRYNIHNKLMPHFKPKISKQTKINLITQYIENDFTPKEFTEWKQNFTENINPITQNEKHEIRQKMNGITMGSDGFFPFYDNIDVANKYGISNIIQPGGSIRDECLIDRCNQYNMAMSMTGIRTFYH